MARTREFDPEDALHRAMGVFWRKGYANTSIEDLVDATGVNRYGLYDEFQSKHGIFLAALDRYREESIGRAIATIEAPGAGLGAIRAFLEGALEHACTEEGRAGCLMTNSAAEVAPYDDQAAHEVEVFRRRLAAAFRGALERARARGELAADAPVERNADFLVGVLHALSVLARSRAGKPMMTHVVQAALAVLR